MSARVAYAWKAGDKWYASIVLPGSPDGYRPRNEYTTRDELIQEVAQRRMALVWEWEGVDGNA